MILLGGRTVRVGIDKPAGRPVRRMPGSTSSPLPVRTARTSVGAMTPTKQETIGMRTMFWTWMTLIAGGLAVMIVLPLLGR